MDQGTEKVSQFWAGVLVSAFIFALIFSLLALCSCGHKSKPTEETDLYAEAVARRDSYVSQIETRLALGEDPYESVPKCDFVTFAGFASAFSTLSPEFEAAETEPGKWVRHPTYPCWSPDPELRQSRSETSFDVYLAVTHWVKTMGRRDILDRMIERGEETSWLMADGPVELTFVGAISPILYEMQGAARLQSLAAESTHREHIAVMFAHLHGRVSGQVSTAELALMAYAADTFPDNPLFQAIYHRYLDGDQTKALEIISRLPAEVNYSVGTYSWGSMPDYLHTLIAVGVIEGD